VVKSLLQSGHLRGVGLKYELRVAYARRDHSERQGAVKYWKSRNRLRNVTARFAHDLFYQGLVQIYLPFLFLTLEQKGSGKNRKGRASSELCMGKVMEDTGVVLVHLRTEFDLIKMRGE